MIIIEERRLPVRMNLIAIEHSVVDGFSFVFFFCLFMAFFSFIDVPARQGEIFVDQRPSFRDNVTPGKRKSGFRSAAFRKATNKRHRDLARRLTVLPKEGFQISPKIYRFWLSISRSADRVTVPSTRKMFKNIYFKSPFSVIRRGATCSSHKLQAFCKLEKTARNSSMFHFTSTE